MNGKGIKIDGIEKLFLEKGAGRSPYNAVGTETLCYYDGYMFFKTNDYNGKPSVSSPVKFDDHGIMRVDRIDDIKKMIEDTNPVVLHMGIDKFYQMNYQ